MNKKSSTRKNLLERSRQEKQLDDILRITKETNRMLQGERNARKIKMIVIVVILLGLAGYGYYLFEKHKIQIIEFQQQVRELQGHLKEASDLVGKVGDTADSIRGIFEGLEPSESETQETE